MRIPELWAGMGRAVNNITAALIANPVLALLSYDSSIAVVVLVLFLFVAVSTVAVVYTFQKKAFAEQLITDATNTVSEKEKLQNSRNCFLYGKRSRGVRLPCQYGGQRSGDCRKSVCLQTDFGTVYFRYLMKTGVKSRVGLLNLYNK